MTECEKWLKINCDIKNKGNKKEKNNNKTRNQKNGLNLVTE